MDMSFVERCIAHFKYLDKNLINSNVLFREMIQRCPQKQL